MKEAPLPEDRASLIEHLRHQHGFGAYEPGGEGYEEDVMGFTHALDQWDDQHLKDTHDEDHDEYRGGGGPRGSEHLHPALRPEKQEYRVIVQRMVETTVTVQAKSPWDAAQRVDQRSFPLPDPGTWEIIKGHTYIVTDAETGETLLEAP